MSKEDDGGNQQNSAISLYLKTEITLGSPELIVGASLIKHKPETLLARLNEFLPNPVEARFYLSIGPRLKHRPKTFSKILRELLGETEISVHDLEVRQGESYAKVDKLLADLETALTLMLRMPHDYNNLRLGAETVARMVIAYGDDVDAFIASVVDNIPEVGEILGYKPRRIYLRKREVDNNCVWYPEGIIAKHAFGFWSHVIYPECLKFGIPYLTEFLDYFDNHQFQMAAIENHNDASKYIDDEYVPVNELNFIDFGFFRSGN